MRVPQIPTAALARTALAAALVALAALAVPALPVGAEEVAPAAYSPADAEGRFVYLVEFAEPGLLGRVSRALNGRLDAESGEARAALAQIDAEQGEKVRAMTSALGRLPEVTHHFMVLQSGVAARLTPEEAGVVAALPGVKAVERERLYELDTYRGPTFIGADTIWDGSAVPGGVGSRGEGMIIGVLDSGVAPTQPSFVNDPACGHGTGGVPNKLLSYLDCSLATGPGGMCNGANPVDTNGHGSHTSSTAGGNAVGLSAPLPPNLPISGVAPCAHLRSYKVCPGTSCPYADIQAGMNSLLLHGDVDVMNFSISGGTSPWTDNDLNKLDIVDSGVVVAASAGNTSTSIPNPVGNVGHRGPWVLTVAASTHDGTSGLVSASGPGTPPANTQDLMARRGSASPVGVALTDHPIRHYTGQDPTMEGCTPGEDDVPPTANPFPAGFFNGSAALIHRGSCSFTKKITNAFNAGANWVLIRNNQAPPLSMNTVGQPAVPAYNVEQAEGNALVAFVDANPTAATMDFLPKGDTLADFSLRGPTPAPLADLTKPDVTAPGVDIYAAVPTSVDSTGYASYSGTSMASPHVAGAATLIRAVQPAWTPGEVKSALMMTAFTGGTKENGSTPWDADDVGHGRVDLSRAARVGFVLDETKADYVAANPAIGGDVKTLNLPSLRNVACSPTCQWTRTVRNTVAAPTTWTATGIAGNPLFDILVSPSTFSFSGGLAETQAVTIRATVSGDLTTAMAFGEVLFTEAGGQSPDLRFTVAIRGLASAGALFYDDFESGDVGFWSGHTP